MPRKLKKNRILIFRDFVFIIIALGIAVDLVFLHFFLFNTPEQKGIRLLKNNQPIEATEHFLKALEEKDPSPFLHLNLGLSYDLQNQPLEAIEKYNEVIKMLPSLPQFFSYFNKAEISARLNRLDEALENYQSALSFDQETQKIKQNIELLLKEGKKEGKDKDSKKNQSQKKNQDDSKQNANESKPSSEKESPQSQPQPRPSELTPEQRKAILKEIEKQESRVRAKQFKSKRRPRSSQEKDW